MKNPATLIYLFVDFILIVMVICLIRNLRNLYKIKKELKDQRQEFADETRPMFDRIGLPPFVITEGAKSIICLYCGWESYNLHDVANKYCGHCHVFIEDRWKQEKRLK